MATPFRDDFSGESSNVDLALHTPSGGAAWTRSGGSSGMAKVRSATADLLTDTTNSAGALYLCDDQGSADQYVQFVARSTNPSTMAANRAVSNVSWICVRVNSSKVSLLKCIPGPTYSVIGSGTTTVSVDDVIRLESEGSTHRVYINGVLELTVTDSHNATVTRQGIVARSTQYTGLLDSFEAGPLSTGGTDGAATGAPAALTLSPPAGSASGGGSATGTPAALTTTAPEGSAAGSTVTHGSATGAPAALILTAPAGSAAGSASAAGAPGALSLSAPAGSATGSTVAHAAATGAPAALTLSALAGSATAGTVIHAATAGVPAALTLAAPAGSAAGSAVASGALAPLAIAAPAGSASATINVDGVASGAPASATLTAPEGSAETESAPGILRASVRRLTVIRASVARTVTFTTGIKNV